MGKVAFLFAGQGAQYPGMGKSLYDNSAAAASIFDLAEAVRPGTKDDCFSASKERLAQTEVTQPCVFTVDLAAASALAEQGIAADGVAGFSLGEMAALTFAKAFPLQEGFRLVCERANLMKTATQQHPGAMAAVMKLPDDVVEQLCGQFDAIYPVNYNCPGQVVVAGDAEQLPLFCAAVKEAGGLARPLAVSGAFHSPYMESASKAFLQQLHQSNIAMPAIPVYANLTGQPYAQDIAQTLADQMQKPVRWHNTITRMGNDGYDTFIEVGPGKTLISFVKRILPNATLLHVQDAETLQQAVSALKP